jgi:mono/diheme cytochrome c family protein
MRIPTPASFVTALLLGLFAIHDAPAQSGLARQGEAIVARDCAMCHAVDRQGLSQNRRAPPLRELPRRMSQEELRRELTAGITAGHPEMPRFRFIAAEVDAIMAHIQAIQDE